MKKNFNFIVLSAAFMLLALVSGCIDNLQPQIDPANETDTYFLSIQANKANAMTKALAINGNTIDATWADGESVDVYKGMIKVGTLIAADGFGTTTTTLSGTVNNTVQADDNLTLKFKSPNYNNQDGTLESIAANCDYATATVEVQSVDNNVVIPKTSSVSFTNQQAIVKFTLRSSTGSYNLTSPNSKISIQFGQNTIAFTLSDAISQYDDGNRRWFFAAIPGGSSQEFTITSDQTTDIYYKHLASVTLANGTYYRISVNMEEADPYTPLTFEAAEEGETIVKFTAGNNINFEDKVQYSKNNGAWTTYNSADAITLSKGETVSFRGSLPAYSRVNTDYQGSNFYCDKDCYLYGNIMSLINPTDYANANFSDQTSDVKNKYAFSQLFKGNTHIKNYPTESNKYKRIVLPATTLTDACYYEMFSGCTGLTKMPTLVARKMELSCYEKMFQGCTSLRKTSMYDATNGLAQRCFMEMFSGCTSLDEMPNFKPGADVPLKSSCYQQMFENCTSLPLSDSFKLPATTLAGNCYKGMFKGCTHITYISSDMLPATTLTNQCYMEMFMGCTSLTTINKLNLPAGKTEGSLAPSCYKSMFEGCTELPEGKVPDLPATTLAESCYERMFAGCHIYTAPTLPATTLVTNCYKEMFYGCTNLNKITCHATNINESTWYSYTMDWLENVSKNGTFIKPDNVMGGKTGWKIGDSSGIPEDWFYAKFTVSDTKAVYFSKANLMAHFAQAGSMYNNCTWSFCNYSKMFVGTANDGANTKINGKGTVSDGGDIDLFGWSITEDIKKYGINNSTDNTDYTKDFWNWGYTNVSGVTDWRTLTQAEWDYLLGLSAGGRTASTVNNVANARFAVIRVYSDANHFSTYGLMIFPDHYVHPDGFPEITTINSISVAKANIPSFTQSQMIEMQDVGAVFLPMAGKRSGTTVSLYSECSDSVLGVGQYWSSTTKDSNECYALVFGSGTDNNFSISVSSVPRFEGRSVRLVYYAN